MKDKGLALKAAGVVFLVVAIMHLLRVLCKLEITVSGIPVRLIFSLIGFFVALSMAIWMFSASKK